MHPDFFRILDLAKQRPIRHLKVNTNGIRIAQDEEFVRRLASYMPDFELYLQFDSFDREPLMQLRGADLRSIRQRGMHRLNATGSSASLTLSGKTGHTRTQT